MGEAQSVEFSDTGPHFSDVQFSATQRSAVERSGLGCLPVFGGGRERPVPGASGVILQVVQDLTERRDRHARSVAVRDAVAGGWDAGAYARASGNTAPLDTPPLF